MFDQTGTRLVWPGEGARRTGLCQPLIVVMVAARAATAAEATVVNEAMRVWAADIGDNCKGFPESAAANLASAGALRCGPAEGGGDAAQETPLSLPGKRGFTDLPGLISRRIRRGLL